MLPLLMNGVDDLEDLFLSSREQCFFVDWGVWGKEPSRIDGAWETHVLGHANILRRTRAACQLTDNIAADAVATSLRRAASGSLVVRWKLAGASPQSLLGPWGFDDGDDRWCSFSGWVGSVSRYGHTLHLVFDAGRGTASRSHIITVSVCRCYDGALFV